MAIKDAHVNCHGYTYAETGVTKREAFRKPPTLATLLRWFSIVPNAREADVIAWVTPTWEPMSSREIIAAHTAVRDGRGRLRFRMGAGGRVERSSLTRLSKEYEPNQYRTVFLVRKINALK